MKESSFLQPKEVAILSANFGLSLKIARQRRGLTQESVAARIGATRETVANAERGKSVTSHNLFAMLWLYGLLAQAVGAISADKDGVGLSLEQSILPKRVRNKRGDNEF